MRVVAARFCCFISLAMFALAPVRGDGPADNHPNSVRRIPKLGVELPAERKAELEASLKELDDLIAPLAKSKDAKVQELLPDVRIYGEAVRTALAYQEFFDIKETGAALELLAEGKQRAQELAAGRSPWTTQTGLVVRGYVSKIDGSVQPALRGLHGGFMPSSIIQRHCGSSSASAPTTPRSAREHPTWVSAVRPM